MIISDTREQFLADIITTAVEGGTGYWAEVHAYKWVDLPPAQVYATIVPTDVVEETPVPASEGPYRAWLSEHGRVINPDLIARGIARIERGDVALRSDLKRWVIEGSRDNDGGMIDADCADCIVQAGLFGEVRYG